MNYHQWRCECSRVLEAIGTMSLKISIANHEREAHNLERPLTEAEVIASPRYLGFGKSLLPRDSRTYSQAYGTCSGISLPTQAEHYWLAQHKILWLGDNRTFEELDKRYRPLEKGL